MKMPQWTQGFDNVNHVSLTLWQAFYFIFLNFNYFVVGLFFFFFFLDQAKLYLYCKSRPALKKKTEWNKKWMYVNFFKTCNSSIL